VVALIAAHDEQDQIAETLASLAAQSRRPDRVLVMADNCSDATVEIARAHGVEVVETLENRARKAGALNQGYALLRDDSADYLLQLDADTMLTPNFIGSAIEELTADPSLGGVCARFFPRQRPGLLGALQRLEYTRYDHFRMRRGGRVSVLSGTAALLRVAALSERPWSEQSLVEDYVLTLELRRHGWDVRAGAGMVAYTDSMISLGALWRQRIRWTRGTLEELRREGWQPWTRADILAHLAIALSIVMRLLWLTALTAASISGRVSWSPLWLLPLILALLEGAIATRKLAWHDRLLALLLIPEELYGLLRQAWTYRAAMLALTLGETTW
jgi:cellulose synthase/poly-beta-1,6-N-acetylglucosamine synthase-like glycosyltransferase